MKSAKYISQLNAKHVAGEHKKRPPRKHCVLCQQEAAEFARWLRDHDSKQSPEVK